MTREPLHVGARWVLLLALMAAAFTRGPVRAWSADEKNLIQNGDFEGGIGPWQPDKAMRELGSFEIEEDEKRGGKVIRIETDSADAEVALCQTVALQPGNTYEVTGHCRSTKLQGTAGVAFYCFDGEGRLIKRVWAHSIPEWGTFGWKSFWAQFSPPKDAASVQLRLALHRAGTVWFDDLAVTKTQAQKGRARQGEPIEDGGFAVQRYETKRPVYVMDVDDLDGDGRQEFVLADIDGVLRCQNEKGQVAWERDMGGLCLALDCGDLDGDGLKESVACTADVEGNLWAIDSRGAELWSYAVPGTMFAHVTVADVDGNGRCEVFATHDNQLVALSSDGKVLWSQSFGGPRFRAVGVGDLTGDGRPEVTVSLSSQRLFAAALDAQGKTLWRYQPPRLRSLSTDDIIIADLDGDGTNEIVLACTAGRVLCVRDGQTVWEFVRERRKLRPKHRDATGHFGDEQSHIAVADFCADRPGLETLVSLLDTVWMLDKDGRHIWESESGILVRRLIPGGAGEVFVPSSGFRDPAFYRLTFTRRRGNPLAEYALPNPIYENLESLYEQVSSAPKLATPPGTTDKFHVLFANLLRPWSKYGSYERLEEISAFLKSKESEHLEFILMLAVKDLPAELHRSGVDEQSEILKLARFFENLGQPFMFFAAHGCSPYLSLDTVEKTLQLAPKTCRGMYVAENTSQYPTAKWDRFVEWVTAVMDLCRKHGGKKLVFKEMFEDWAFVPSDSVVQSTLLRPEYKDTIVAMYATNNPYAPELQLGGMAGLKQAGLISDWGISTQYWNWSWDAHRTRQDNWAHCPADAILSMELTSACLGGRWFHIEGGQEYLVLGKAELSPRAKRHRDIVYELIRKNILLPIRDEDNLSFSNVVVVRRNHPLVDELRAADDTPSLGPPYGRPLGPLRQGLLGVNDALQTTPPDYLPRYAYGSRRYAQTMAPQTPYGFVRIVPDCARTAPFAAGKRAIETDGCDVFIRGRRVTAADARPAILAALREEAERLPARADGAAVFTHRVGEELRVFILDPGYMCPAGVKAELQPHSSLGPVRAHNLLTGQQLAVTNGRVRVEVSPGAFRVVVLRPA